MSTDGVRFAHCVSEGSSLRLRGEESGQRLEPLLTRGRERGKGWSLRSRGERAGQRLEPLLTRGREAKAGAFAYPGEESRAKAGAFAYAGKERGKGWSLRLRGEERQRLEPSLTLGKRAGQRLESSLTQLCRFYWTSFTVRTWKGVNARGTRRFSSICSDLIGSSKMLTRSASRRGVELSMMAWPRSP